MNSDDNRSAPSSGTTTESEQKAQAKLTEAQFLQQTAAEVKAAISKTIGDLKQDALTAADIRLWSKEHPWAVVGAAAAAGFVAATLVTPAKNQDLKDKFTELIDTIKSQGNGESKTEQAKTGSGMLAPLLAMAAGAAQNYVMSLMHPAAPTEQPAQPAAAGDGNGSYRASAVG
jgi:ElaB/YqjD/DUF883 family membrane-anchored ribosome-binding protein